MRLQGLVENAYGTQPCNVKQLKVIWQFLNGLKDKDVRESLIKEKWMIDGANSKPYEEILKIAETAVNTKKAARATGKGGYLQNANVSVVSSNRRGLQGRQGEKTKDNPRFRNQGEGGQTAGGNWECYYCKTNNHGGGWFRCPTRRKDNPKWRPGDKEPGFR